MDVVVYYWVVHGLVRSGYVLHNVPSSEYLWVKSVESLYSRRRYYVGTSIRGTFLMSYYTIRRLGRQR